MSQSRHGYLYAIGASVCWGLFPLYWKVLRPSSALELVAHRIVWSFVFLAMVMAVVRQWRAIVGIARRPRTFGLIALASLTISANWCVYIYGVNTDHVVETSLGYFMNPLANVLLGVLVLRERLGTAQWVAVAIAGVAVAVLTVDYGRVPYIAVMLAVSFAFYALIKKRAAVPAHHGLFVESGVAAVPALGVILALAARGQATVGAVSASHTALTVLTGAISSIPLLLFAAAANRISLTAIGVLQYLGPTMQFGCGVLIFHEPMPAARLGGFALVWLALAVFTWDGIRRTRRHRALATATP